MTLRIGTLGAARITPMALLRPARLVQGVQVVAVAARDRSRAERFARRQGISRVHDSYDALLADPQVDAIYNPLPNSLHCEWTVKALQAGKHVLCEKPFASNAAEAQQMANAAVQADRVLMEAFHWRYHPFGQRMVEVVQSGELGDIEHIEAYNAMLVPEPGNIRYRWDLAGGALMDMGAYPTSWVRHMMGEEPEVISARARLSSPKVDRWMQAEIRFPSGTTGRITTALFSRHLVHTGARVQGTKGELRVYNPVLPHLFSRFKVRTAAGTRRERFGRPATYVHQLQAFRDAVVEGRAFPTTPEDAVKNMAFIDAIYRAAGLPLRGS
jgi:predicted dehydrogenase